MGSQLNMLIGPLSGADQLFQYTQLFPAYQYDDNQTCYYRRAPGSNVGGPRGFTRQDGVCKPYRGY